MFANGVETPRRSCNATASRLFHAPTTLRVRLSPRTRLTAAGARFLLFGYNPGMVPSPSAQLSALIESIGEQLQSLQDSKAALLNALEDTDQIVEELHADLENARRLLYGLSK